MSPAGDDHRLPFVGLTGGMAAGKSEALKALERLGAATLSADAVVHELLDDTGVREVIVERFGAQVAPGGAIDRDALGRAAFDAAEGREWLERQLWPRVGERIAAWRGDLERAPDPPRAAVVEVPLLFESGMEDAFDYTLAIVAAEDVRLRRAGERGHSGLEQRTARQLSQDEKAQRADFVVANDGSIAELEQKLRETLARMGP